MCSAEYRSFDTESEGLLSGSGSRYRGHPPEVEVHDMSGHGGYDIEEGQGARTLFSRTICGVIANDKVPLFERMIFRVSRGNAVIRMVPIDELLPDAQTGISSMPLFIELHSNMLMLADVPYRAWSGSFLCYMIVVYR